MISNSALHHQSHLVSGWLQPMRRACWWLEARKREKLGCWSSRLPPCSATSGRLHSSAEGDGSYQMAFKGSFFLKALASLHLFPFQLNECKNAHHFLLWGSGLPVVFLVHCLHLWKSALYKNIPMLHKLNKSVPSLFFFFNSRCPDWYRRWRRNEVLRLNLHSVRVRRGTWT